MMYALAATTIIAETMEIQRTVDMRVRPSALHGTLTINGNRYDFVTGGRGRGSIPFGGYSIGREVIRPYLGGVSYPLSDVYDPIVRDVRSGLFIHRGGPTSHGCISIAIKQWSRFETDMREVLPDRLLLVAGKMPAPSAAPAFDAGGIAARIALVEIAIVIIAMFFKLWKNRTAS